MKRSIFLLMAALSLFSTPVLAQKAVLTGGQNGAYHSTFCPPLPAVLSQHDFPNYKCTTSEGTLDNIKQVLAKPSNIGFVQLDVFARESQAHPEYAQQLTIIRKDIACEGLWAVTKNTSITNFGDLLGRRRTPYLIANGGSAASFAFLQSVDPDGLGRAKNIRVAANATEVINTVAASQDNVVGFFVQWANPENNNIKLMVDKGLNVVPVVSREVQSAKVNGEDVYSVQEFNLTASGFISNGKTVISACTPVALITGNPDAQKDRDAKDDQRDLIKAVREIPSSALLPQESKLAALMKSVRVVSGSALNEMLAAADKAKKAAEQLSN